MINLSEVTRFGVTGGRFFDNWSIVVRALVLFPRHATLVHGAAPGADSLCAQWWVENGGRAEPHAAHWSDPCTDSCQPDHRRPRPGWGGTYCPAAGSYRNEEMAASGLQVLVAFPGNNNGMADMTSRCQLRGIPLLEALTLNQVSQFVDDTRGRIRG